MTEFGAANQVTAGRALLVVVLASVAFGPVLPLGPAASAAVGAAVVLLDGVDGWIARRTGTTTPFGARFDMEVDALLILVLSAMVWQHGKAGAWVLTSGLMRYLFVAAGWWLPWLRRPLPSSVRRRIVCVVQALALIVALLPAVDRPLSGGLAAISLAALAYSFLVDTVWLVERRSAAMVV
jgi:phosphatidylglycerophosphate synthase